MSKIKKIVTSQVEARATSDKIEPNTYSYDTSGVIVYHDNNSNGAAVQAPGIIYGANGNGTEPTGLDTIRLIPHQSLATDQYLIIEPTDPNHIHIRAGGAPDNSSAELILGAENTHVLVSDSTDQITIKSASGQFLNDPSNPSNQIATMGDVQTNGSWDAQFTDASGTLAGHTYTGNYNRVGNIIFYCVNVDFAAYTNLGTGQYQFTLPYAPRQTFTSRAGTLHNHTTDSLYHIAAIVDINEAGGNIARLYYSGSTTDLNWKYNSPVSWASTSTHFDISGFYEIAP